MKPWEPRTPTPSALGDHDVPSVGRHLENRRIALLVCGGIAAMRAPLIARALRRYGAHVVAYMSKESARYVTADTLAWSTNNSVVTELTWRSEHLSKDSPFDAYLVAPATYNTINKMRYGLADSPVTSTLATALGLLERDQTQILVAPTLHGDMHNSVLEESLRTLAARGMILIPPRDEYGKHNIPDCETIVAYTCVALSKSKLKGLKILLSAGSTPTPIDNVRCISNRFRGRLGVEIARELALRGADVRLIMGAGSVPWPRWISGISVPDFDAYKKTVLKELDEFQPSFGIFSAAVADYAPTKRFAGKVPSRGFLKSIDLVPTEKIVDLARDRRPEMGLISFKYQENISLGDLFDIANQRVRNGHLAVIANRGEDMAGNADHIAYLVTSGSPPRKLVSKPGIALGICDFIEEVQMLFQSRLAPTDAQESHERHGPRARSSPSSSSLPHCGRDE
ncbi:MAG: phosphopantothenoylcysteine decarboxylase [Bdellovibrionales bacterium]